MTAFVTGCLGQCAVPAAADGGSDGGQMRQAAGAASITSCTLRPPACCVAAPLGASGSMPAPEQRGTGPTAGGRQVLPPPLGAGTRRPSAGTPPDQAGPKVLVHAQLA